MKRILLFSLVVTVAAVLAWTPDSRSASFGFYNYRLRPFFWGSGLAYRYPFFTLEPYPNFGLMPPYERGRRPLNVPDTSRLYSRPPERIIYVYNPPPPAAYGNWPFAPGATLPPAAQAMLQNRPPVIEREKVIFERQPEDSTAGREEKSQVKTSFLPSHGTGDTDSFVRQMDQAQRLFRDRRYKEAVEAYHRASGLKPNTPMVKMGQCLALFAVGDYEGAASALRRALILHPDWYKEPILLATFYGDTNDFNAHLAVLERFLGQHPEHVEARFLTAYFYFVLDRLSESAETLATILEKDPGDLEATSLLGNLAALQQKTNS
ncbi:MAG: tetratricopeptide repeat protein [bacterium]